MRGQFAVNEQQYSAILEQARLEQMHGLFLISTCNRTELYATSGDREQLISLLCNHSAGDAETFRRYAYFHYGRQAITHFFAVAAGLDSQLIGDYEIVGQLKQAFKFSKERNGVDFFLERLYNQVQQASKEIKNQTQLSNGSVSIAVAAVQRVKEVPGRDQPQRILLIGIGHIGQNIAKNLVKHFPPAQVKL